MGVTARTASAQRIRRHATEILGDQVLTEAELAEGLRADGLELGDDEIRVSYILDESTAFIQVEDGWASVPSQLEGTAWCTAVTDDDAVSGLLPIDPNLNLLGWWLLDTPLPLAGTDALVHVLESDDDDDLLDGPPGWLDGFGGRTVAVSVTAGHLGVHPVEEPPVSPALAGAFSTVFDEHARHDEMITTMPDDESVTLVTISLEDLLWEVLVAHRAACTAGPVPPVDQVLAAAGLARRDHTIARSSFDWDALERWRRRRRLAYRYDLSGDQIDAAEIVLGASYALISEEADPLGPPDEAPASAMLLSLCLHDPKVADALWREHLEVSTPPEDLVRFARRLLEDLPPPAGSGARWLAARALDLAGDPLAAEAELREVLELDAQDTPHALQALAAFAADRGDAKGALSLLRRAGVDHDDKLLSEVVGYASARPRPTASRNDPCPCGSGRKYKACHLGREQVSLLDRGSWLYAKACRYVRDNRHRPLAADIAAVIREASQGGPASTSDLLDSELVADLVLCEAEVWADFVAERSALLPDDEALLASQWQLVERSLFEIEEVAHDRLRLRDVRTGDRIVVTNSNADPRTRPGMLLLGRPLPVGDTWRAYAGFVAVSGPVVDGLLDALDGRNPFRLAHLVGSTFAPPRLQNSDGQDLVFHELIWQVADLGVARAALAASGLADDGDDRYSLVRDSENRRDTIIANLSLDEGRLRATVNSDERATEVRALVAGLLPDATVVDDDVRRLDEVMASTDDDDDERAEPSLDDPAVRELVADHIARYEQQWLDEPIPALRGRTPRDAADDPIGRHELEQLLATFPPGDEPTMMSAARIRTALGLDR